ncbi:chromobox protein homolog 3-like [Perognathus longimembris pacificus]|uniref:chromobox protein homolog 3-like n=1 Tax=Perognathus longimembris pacificus TaxID=214514 RepID=UPI0020193D53|nr:chromobox protein homolog 3-like [Perognathus longimembris pacificus]
MASKDTLLPKRIMRSENSEGAGLEEFEAEKIVDQRVLDGQVQYLLKWKGYPDADNTWEAEEHLNCPELMEEFLNSQNDILCNGESYDSTSGYERGAGDYPRGFTMGLEPEEILGARENMGLLMLLMKWKNCDQPEWVLAKEANVQCPEVVIAFYEAKLP